MREVLSGATAAHFGSQERQLLLIARNLTLERRRLGAQLLVDRVEDHLAARNNRGRLPRYLFLKLRFLLLESDHGGMLLCELLARRLELNIHLSQLGLQLRNDGVLRDV